MELFYTRDSKGKRYLKSSLTEPAVVELASHLGRKDRLDLEEV